MSRSTFALITSLGVTILSAAGGEVVLRTVFAGRTDLSEDERSLTYQYDPRLGWFPRQSSEFRIRAEREISVRHNAAGFRDHEHGPKQKPRILVLGDSFVWGFDVEQSERFTERLQASLSEWEILNLGVSGYGTDQEYLLLRQYFDVYQPEIVFLVFSQSNDRDDNSTNFRYGSYYKPYFRASDSGLEVAGLPVPKSIRYYDDRHPVLLESYLVRAVLSSAIALRHPRLALPDPTEALLRAMRELVQEHGSAFAVGVQGRGSEISDFGREAGIPMVRLANRHRFTHFGGHWNPKGHAVVARRIHEFLGAQGWLEPGQVE